MGSLEARAATEGAHSAPVTRSPWRWRPEELAGSAGVTSLAEDVP
jgi:hypothetical protein